MIFLGQQQIWAARKGAVLRVQRTDQQTFEGELIAVRNTQFILVDSNSRDMAIDISEVSLIVIKKEPHTWKGVLLGVVAGGVIGVALAPSKTLNEPTDIFTMPIEQASSKMGYGLGGMLAGGVLGGLIGAAIGSDSQIVVSKMSPEEREHLLVKLSSKARVKKVT
jgi:hypothetical protein